MSREVVIVSAARTPIGSFGGVFASVTAPQLGATAIKEALSRASVEGGDVDQVYMGCVLPAGVGQAPARQASLGAGVPNTVGCVTLNKVCGSGLMAVIQAAQAVKAIEQHHHDATNPFLFYLLFQHHKQQRTGVVVLFPPQSSKHH